VKENVVRLLALVVFLATVAATVSAIVHLFAGGNPPA